MDIQQLITQLAPTLLAKLQETGFSTDQAEQFLPEAGESIAGNVGAGDLVSLLAGGDPVAAILEKVDIGALASKLGIDSGLATQGLQSILPQLVEGLKSEGGGGLLGSAAKLGGKLFGG